MKYQIIFFLIVSVMFSIWSVCNAAPAYASKNYTPQTPVKVKTFKKKDGTVVTEHYRALPGKGCGGNGCTKK